MHVAACEPWLLAELRIVRPQGAVVLGATAGKALYGSRFLVGDSRGRLHEWPRPPEVRGPGHTPDWVVATAHPASVLRSRERKRDYESLVADLVLARQALGD